MATINFAGSWIAKGVHQTQWTMGNADTGVAQSSAALPDKTVQISGTMGGATIIMQGSNDGSVWDTLKDSAGVAISTTTAAIKKILENTKFIRPVTSGGAGSAITVTLVERSGQI